MRCFLVACLALLVFALSGCSSIRVTVSTFRDPAQNAQPGRIAVAPWREQLKNSLEFKTYASQVEMRLRAKGFDVVSLDERPQLVAFLDFGIDEGRQVLETYEIPQYGVTGISSSNTTGTITSYGGGYGTYSGTTTYTPQYGVTGYTTGVTERTEYSRYVNLDIVRFAQSTRQKIYEAKLRSRGSCGNLPAVMPVLLDVLFTDFPTSVSRTVNVPWDRRC